MNRLALCLPFALFLIVGPSIRPSAGQQEKKLLVFTSDLLPLKVGEKWTYQGNDPKEKVIVIVERMEPFKRRIAVKSSERVETLESYVLKISSGDKSLREQIVITEDGIYRYAAAGKEIDPPLKILKLPPVKGESWSCESKSENIVLRGDFVVDKVNVSVPGYSGEAWLSKTRDFTVGDQKMEASYWFAPGKGIVKQHVKVGKFEMSIALDGPGVGGPSIGGITVPGIEPPPGLPLPKLDIK